MASHKPISGPASGPINRTPDDFTKYHPVSNLADACGGVFSKDKSGESVLKIPFGSEGSPKSIMLPLDKDGYVDVM
ncbi:MAG TPA: hypothetical protein EYO58_06485, partial [Flavobacteriales bacterium]|nr:hypothetical protein [Flavobacteriales bacterium]